MRHTLRLSLFTFLVLALTGCMGSRSAGELNTDYASMSIGEIAVTGPEFSTFASAVASAGLTDTFMSDGSYTVFAPTDEAFDRLPETIREDLMDPANADELAEVLKYHVVANRYTADDLGNRASQRGVGTVQSLQGDELTINAGQNQFLIEEATVTAADIVATNGIIHAVDEVLLPPTYDDAVR